MNIYLVGSLNNPEVTNVASQLRVAGFDVFDDWMAAGYEADKKWQEYEKAKGHNFKEALDGFAAWHVFNYDKEHLLAADVVVLLMPCGRSGHLELGWAIGKGKPGYILLPGEPDRYDCMYRFADGVFYAVEELVSALALLPSEEEKWCRATAAYSKDFAEGKNDHY